MVDITTKVHIVLDQTTTKDPEKRHRVLEKIVDRVGIRDVNLKRMERFGIISGVMDSGKLNVLREMPEVRSVSGDEERYAL